MSKELFDRVKAFYDQASEAKFIVVPDNPNKHMMVLQGVATEVVSPNPIRGHKVRTVESFVQAVNRWDRDGEGSIWVNAEHNYIQAILNDERLDDRVTLILEPTKEWARLEKLDQNPNLDQAAIIRLLRIEFSDVAGGPQLLQAVRRIKFSASTNGESNIQHGNESLGRTVEAAVTGVDTDIVKGFDVNTHIFRNAESPVTIGCDLEINPTARNFRVTPLPDLLANSLDKALSDIADEITKKVKPTLFFGTP